MKVKEATQEKNDSKRKMKRRRNGKANNGTEEKIDITEAQEEESNCRSTDIQMCVHVYACNS